MPIGLADNVRSTKFPDSAFSASSYESYGQRPSRGRLNAKHENDNNMGAWMTNNDPWIQIYLKDVIEIGGIITQGHNGYPYWVTKFQVSYSKDGKAFFYVKQAGSNNEVSLLYFIFDTCL
ncbi:probable carboxypeptidase X1 [Antedon mediterranea]|uniref:probable carboxypeptidase X1 n=1 Tax=Antedon mediterranea TaxID=105859 RepID=UPI003AF9793C